MKKTGFALLSILGKIWALPTTLVGLLCGLAGVCAAPREVRVRLGNNAICFYHYPLLPELAGGLTLGNVILLKGESTPIVEEHEKQHTFQAEVLGPFYIPLHVICLVLYGRDVMSNPLERGPYSTPPRPW